MSTAGSTPDFADRTDFDDADRGLVAEPADARVPAEDGRVVRDSAARTSTPAPRGCAAASTTPATPASWPP
ncbi:hypothetical protein [Streptomyces sp. NPDC002644]